MPSSARARRRLIVAGAIGLPLLCLVVLGRLLVASAPTAYAWGDGALLELYTLHASRGFWLLGPYSHFGWHHPGPLLFYALLPAYALSGFHAFGLNAGALAINLAAVMVIAWVAARWASPITGCAILLMAAAYLFRVGDIAISYWNPHVVILPLAALMLLCAGVAAGRAAALPAVAAVASFLTQTHVSLVPSVAAMVTVSLMGLAIGRARGAGAVPRRSMGTWIAISAGVLALLWWPSLVEEVHGRPGNLSTLARFFTEPYEAQPWTMATAAWGDAISALFSGDFRIPTGASLQLGDSGMLPMLAAAQLLVLMLAAWDANRRGDRFLASLCWTGVAASLVALWSITRIRAFVGEYMVFWISLVGALNWAALAAAALTRLRGTLHLSLARYRAPGILAVVVVAGFLAGEAAQLHHNTRQPLEDGARSVAALTEALQAHMQRASLERPLVRISGGAWPQAAGVIVRLYKLGVPVSVPPELVEYFGEPLVRSGHDATFYIADTAASAELSKRPGDIVIARHDALSLHADAEPGRE